MCTVHHAPFTLPIARINNRFIEVSRTKASSSNAIGDGPSIQTRCVSANGIYARILPPTLGQPSKVVVTHSIDRTRVGQIISELNGSNLLTLTGVQLSQQGLDAALSTPHCRFVLISRAEFNSIFAAEPSPPLNVREHARRLATRNNLMAVVAQEWDFDRPCIHCGYIYLKGM
jgi:hypothetical protein